AEDGIRDFHVTGVQTCALPILQTRAAVGGTAIGLENVVVNPLACVRAIHPATGCDGAVVEIPLLDVRQEMKEIGTSQALEWSFEIGRASCRERGMPAMVLRDV